MLDIKYIVTGTPRSATRYMSDLFCKAGIPMSHELIWGFPNNSKIVKNMKGESSWMAAAYLQYVEDPDIKIIHITRDPVKVINSLMADNNLKGLGGTIYGTYKILVMPDLLKYQGIDRYVYFYLAWNKIIENYRDYWFKIEDINKDPRKMFKELDIDVDKDIDLNLEKSNKHHNNKKYKDLDFILDNIKDENLKASLLDFINKYNYKQ